MNNHNTKERIIYIIDMDGFNIGNSFLCKELGIFDIYSNTIQSYYFKVCEQTNFSLLNEFDKKTASFCRNNIHGLKFEDNCNIDLPQKELLKILQNLSYTAYIRGSQFDKSTEYLFYTGVIAFKGGVCEKNLLDKLEIKNYINLEHLGCPKFDNLIKNEDYLYVICDYKNKNKNSICKRHLPLKKNEKMIHCPQIEVLCFTYWYKNNYVQRI